MDKFSDLGIIKNNLSFNENQLNNFEKSIKIFKDNLN
jgi:hypothetical protein